MLLTYASSMLKKSNFLTDTGLTGYFLGSWLRYFLIETLVQLDKLGKVAVEMKEGESVYDYQWYPLMNSASPETCCLATTSQHQPIHLYDAFDGHIRATYR